MRILLALLLSIPTLHIAPPPRPVGALAVARPRKGGRWYMAKDGHAVYCYGPTMFVAFPNGSIQQVATFCREDRTIVPLKD
jgi:hypothetical protein